MEDETSCTHQDPSPLPQVTLPCLKQVGPAPAVKGSSVGLDFPPPSTRITHWLPAWHISAVEVSQLLPRHPHETYPLGPGLQVTARASWLIYETTSYLLSTAPTRFLAPPLVPFLFLSKLGVSVCCMRNVVQICRWPHPSYSELVLKYYSAPKLPAP